MGDLLRDPSNCPVLHVGKEGRLVILAVPEAGLAWRHMTTHIVMLDLEPNGHDSYTLVGCCSCDAYTADLTASWFGEDAELVDMERALGYFKNTLAPKACSHVTDVAAALGLGAVGEVTSGAGFFRFTDPVAAAS